MIDNPKSARVRRVAALVRKKERSAEGRFLVEGPQAVRELLVHRPEHAVEVFATTGAESWQGEVDRLADAAGVRLTRVTDAVLAAMSDTVHPQGVVAVATTSATPVSEVCANARLIAVLHEVRDPGNAGAVLRAADAAGADAVVFAGDSIDPWHPKVVRATTGSLFHLPVAVVATLGEAVSSARTAGLRTVAADVRGAELAPGAPVLRDRLAWVFGNEARGLTTEDRELVGEPIRLPIFGSAESLNLATAAAVCLYTTAFAQRA